MHRGRQVLLYVMLACASAPALWARSSSPAQEASTARSSSDLSIQRALLSDANNARKAGDHPTARAITAEVVAALLALPAAEQDAEWLDLLSSAGTAAYGAKELRTAESAFKRVYEVRSATLPDDHPAVQRARFNLASTLSMQGDLAGARPLQEKVLEVMSRTLPDDDANFQGARESFALTLFRQGDFAGARALQEKVLEVHLHTFPDDHPAVQRARANLASTLREQGDLARARALCEKVFDVRSRTLPEDHPDLQSARQSLATVLSQQGDLVSARALRQKVVDVFSRTLPDDHPDLQWARANLAVTLDMQGDLASARALEEKVLDVFSRTLPDDHPDLQWARATLAITLDTQGDLSGARALREKVLEVRSRILPDDHPELQSARANLALTLKAQGDSAGARALEEKVLEVFSRTLPDDHPDLQAARANLAVTLESAGDLAGARALEEKVLEVRSRTLPADHPALQGARANLAGTLHSQGDLAGARALREKVLEVYSRTLPDDHPALQWARANLATTIACQAARERHASGGEEERERESERCTELIGALCRAQVHAARAAMLASPGREAEERCASLARRLDVSLSFARGYGAFEPLVELERDSFELAETTRGAALASAELARRAAHSPRYAELRETLLSASDALANLAQKGTTSEEFDRARVKRESAERELVALARELSGGTESGVELDVASLAGRLGDNQAAVSFRRYTKARVEVLGALDSAGQPAVREPVTESLCAFVVRSSRIAPTPLLTLVDLGPIEPIEEAARAWREALGVSGASRGVGVSADVGSSSRVHASGVALREKLLDPLRTVLAGASRIVVVLDDVLHLVPLDALPLDEKSLVGDRFDIETRTTLTELLLAHELVDEPRALVAFGDVDYRVSGVAGADAPANPTAVVAPDVRPGTADAQPGAAAAASNATLSPSLLRGSAWAQGFSALAATGDEVRGIARCFTKQFGDGATSEVCEHSNATRERLLAVGPQARYLHIATHGWFAPESIKAWSDSEPIDKQSGLGTRMNGAEQVRGMSPMLLCGLALAGANLPEDAVGRAPGLITADELSTLDLSNCELAVLSACDTNVGINRAGQGVASLQKALQMAGARSVITSLWKVPDEATKELMLDFYRRLWVEKKPKHQALWEAKTKLREAKDESGALKYTTRDWAAWVLTGSPD